MKEISQRLLAVLFLTTIAPAAIEKFAGGETPKWFLDQFASTFLAHLPGGLPVAFFGIAALEAVASLLILAAFFGRKRIADNQVYKFGLIATELLFISLAFGQRLVHKYDEAALLFVYAFVTFVVLALQDRLNATAPVHVQVRAQAIV